MLLCVGCSNPDKPAVKDGYWVWRQSDLLQVIDASELVLYQGNFIRENQQVSFFKKGVSVYPFKQNGEVTLLLRVYELPSSEYFIQQVEYLVRSWEKVGIKVKGIQIDYDSPSAKLMHYRQFLKPISTAFGQKFVSITGLSSWLSDNIDGLNQLGDTVDYVAIQFYQAHKPVPSSSRHNVNLANLTLNYKIGVTTSALFDQITFKHTDFYLGKLTFLNGHTL